MHDSVAKTWFTRNRNSQVQMSNEAFSGLHVSAGKKHGTTIQLEMDIFREHGVGVPNPLSNYKQQDLGFENLKDKDAALASSNFHGKSFTVKCLYFLELVRD